MRELPFRLFTARFDEIIPKEDLLDGPELKRLRQLKVAEKKREFVAARTFLKTVLGEELKISPKQLSLAYSKNGKPYLPEIYGRDLPHFNMSHSGDWVVVVLADRMVGVDIECESNLSLQSLSPIINAEERIVLSQHGQFAQRKLIKELFVAKEAYIKVSDKQFTLDKINFFLENGQWQLKDNPQGYSFYFQCASVFTMCVCC